MLSGLHGGLSIYKCHIRNPVWAVFIQDDVSQMTDDRAQMTHSGAFAPYTTPCMQKTAFSYTRTVWWSPHPYVIPYYSTSTQPIKAFLQWNSALEPSPTGQACPWTFVQRGKNARTATGMPRHKQRHPPIANPPPSTPFEAVFADFFDYHGRHYLVVGDRLSGWVEILGSPASTDLAGSSGLIRHLRTFFATFGVPEELSSDGGPEFTAKPTEDFLQLWGVRHRLSSVSFPQSNGRAEVAVKTAKRLLMSNTGPTGNLNHDRFLSAILQLRNTPDPDCNLSPAQIIFGRPLRDTLSFVNRLEKFTNPHIRPLWRDAWSAKEDALRARFTRTTEKLEAHSRPLRPLLVGERVFLQNQQGPHPTKWDRSGVIVESLSHDQYRVKVDGSGRLTLRNRRFLRAYTPATPTIQTHQPPVKPDGVNAKHERPSPVGPDLGISSPTPAVAPNIIPTARAQSPPTTASPPPDDCEPQPGTVNPEPPAPPMDSPPGPTLRPRRSLNPPKHYEPETGTWIR